MRKEERGRRLLWWRRVILLLFAMHISFLVPPSSFLDIDTHAANFLTERYNLTSLDLSNGLPHNHVNDIFKDSEHLKVATNGNHIAFYVQQPFQVAK